MAFWSDGVTEPRRNFKFLLTVGTLPLWIVKQVNLPAITVAEGTHKFLNHTFYFPGTVEYNEVSFTVVDSINEEVTKRILESFIGSGYNTPEQSTASADSLITKGQATHALGAVRIEQLGSGQDGQTNKIAFVLRNAWINNLEFATGLNYDSSDPSEISVKLRYDFFNFADTAGTLPGFGG